MIQDNSPALAPQRRERLRQMLREGGVARVEELRKSLEVSVATIRRDLEILEEEGKIRRVHGGWYRWRADWKNLSSKTKPIYPPKTNRPLRRRRTP